MRRGIRSARQSFRGCCLLLGWVGLLFFSTASHADAGAGSNGAISIAFGGDVTLGYHYQEYFDDQLAKGSTREQMLAYPFAEVKSVLKSADLAVVNLECPFTERGEKIPKNFNFRARPELVTALLQGGVAAVSLANNHLVDYGAVGLSDTLQTLESARLAHFGAGNTLREARRPAIIERQGIKLALLGYFCLGDHNIEPPEVVATDQRAGVAGHPSSLEVMKQMVRDDVVRARGSADLVIPFFHWGREGMHFPEPYQVELAHLAVDAGAAAVIGSHPHVLQGMELFRGAPIYYSLGNFVFGGNWDPKVKEAALISVRLSAAGYLSTRIIPIQINRHPEFPLQPFVLSGAAAETVMRHLATYSSGLGQMLPELVPWKN